MCKIMEVIRIINERNTLKGRLERLERHLEKALDWRNDPCAFREPWKYIELTRQRIDACNTLIEANEREMIATGMPECVFRINPKQLLLKKMESILNG